MSNISRCGYPLQFSALQDLYKKLRSSFKAFPKRSKYSLSGISTAPIRAR